MADEKFAIQLDPDKAFQQMITAIAAESGDLTIPFITIAKEWFRGNQAIFKLRGPGKYTDLSDRYKPRKLRDVGFVYPILKRSGHLMRSLTTEPVASGKGIAPASSDSVAQILNKTVLRMGTKDRTAIWHQTGAGRLPERPMVFLGPEQTAPEQFNQRMLNWVVMLSDHYSQLLARRAKK